MSSAISLPSAVVADANVVLSALIGGRARHVFASPLGPACFAAQAVVDEVVEYVRGSPRAASTSGCSWRR